MAENQTSWVEKEGRYVPSPEKWLDAGRWTVTACDRPRFAQLFAALAVAHRERDIDAITTRTYFDGLGRRHSTGRRAVLLAAVSG